MSPLLVALLVFAIAALGYIVARTRAAAHDGGKLKPHSRAHYHGWWSFLLAAAPAILFLIVWTIGSSIYVERGIHSALPNPAPEGAPNEALSVSLVKSLARALNRLDSEQIANLPATFAELQPMLAAKGVALASDTQDYMVPIAVATNRGVARLGLIGGAVSLVLAAAGAFLGVRQVAVRARARNQVEKVMLWVGSSRVDLQACKLEYSIVSPK